MTICLLLIGDLFHELFCHEAAFLDQDCAEKITAWQGFKRRHSGCGIVVGEPFILEIGALHWLQTFGRCNTDGLTDD